MNAPRTRVVRRPVHGVLLIDKPLGMTSNQALQKAKWLLRAEKAGHTGTLDPMASGLLPLTFGEATKFSQTLLDADKAYDATVLLGVTTTTADAEGEVLARSAVEVTDAAIETALASLRGDIEQVPATVSAIKVDGERAYKLVREGKAPELAARRVRIERFTIDAVRRVEDFVDVDVTVDCSSGTYIRALARDVGAAIGVGGHLTALRRTKVGRYGLDEARTLEQLTDAAELSYSLDAACLLGFPRRDLTEAETEDTRHGRALAPAGIDGTYAATAADGRVIALLEDGPKRTSSVVVLRPATL